MKKIITLCIGLISALTAANELPDYLKPELAKVGSHKVGVKTVSFVQADQLQFPSLQLGDRKLTLEVWYPAKKSAQGNAAVYENVTRLHKPFAITGKAIRDAQMETKNQYPLVVISHGYTGYRQLMHYLGEHLASHGYVVAAIDHTDATNADVDMQKSPFSGFPSTLYYRSRDQLATLDYMAQLSEFKGNIDANRSGLIGYSMGGYGAISSLGGCYQFNDAAIKQFTGITDASLVTKAKALFSFCNGGKAEKDQRFKAAMVMAPWGNGYQLFNQQSLKNITAPLLLVDGSLDDIANYHSIEQLYQALPEQNHFMLTYNNARHNIAPHPAPKVAYENEFDLGHYYEFAWRSETLNAINQHFALAMMNCYLKQDNSSCDYLKLSANSDDENKPWKGFAKRFSNGMRWQSK